MAVMQCKAVSRVFAVLAAGAALGCGPFGAHVEPLATSVQSPSNVAVYVSVTQEGQPVSDLTRESFQISEDGQALDPEKVSFVVLPRDAAAEHRTLVLVDATLATTPDDRRTLATAVTGLVKSVAHDQAVSVAAFDGTEKLTPIGEVEKGSSKVELDALEKLAPQDPSRNLNGAVIAALSQLDSTLASADKPVRIGTLVVLTGGPDVAGRVTPEELAGELRRSRDHVLAVGVGADTGSVSLDRIGRDGTFRAQTLSTVSDALDKTSARLVAIEHSHYLLAYCSPARGGLRQLTVAVNLVDSAGKPNKASADVRFSADGFTAGCNSKDAPRFVVRMLATNDGSVPAVADFAARPTAGASPAEPPKAKPHAGHASKGKRKSNGQKGQAGSQAGGQAFAGRACDLLRRFRALRFCRFGAGTVVAWMTCRAEIQLPVDALQLDHSRS